MCVLWLVLSLQCTLEGGSTVIRGTSSGADDVIGNGKCVLSGHLREAIWMIASNYEVLTQSIIHIFEFMIVDTKLTMEI